MLPQAAMQPVAARAARRRLMPANGGTLHLIDAAATLCLRTAAQSNRVTAANVNNCLFARALTDALQAVEIPFLVARKGLRYLRERRGPGAMAAALQNVDAGV
jgi:hypothetical protein